MSRFKLIYFVIFTVNLYKIDAQISDKRLCVDEECKVPISYAKTLLRYSSPDSRILSFAPNVDITIYSKSAGSREDLWGGEINGKRGYVPKHMVRETKILQKPTLLVNTEFSNDTENTQVPSKVEPNKVQEPYEVVDGTTIYLNPQEDISPSSTESTVQPTALPGDTSKVEPTVTETPQDIREPSLSEEKETSNDSSINQNSSTETEANSKEHETKENQEPASVGDTEEIETDDEEEIDMDDDEDEDDEENEDEANDGEVSDELKESTNLNNEEINEVLPKDAAEVINKTEMLEDNVGNVSEESKESKIDVITSEENEAQPLPVISSDASPVLDSDSLKETIEPQEPQTSVMDDQIKPGLPSANLDTQKNIEELPKQDLPSETVNLEPPKNMEELPSEIISSDEQNETSPNEEGQVAIEDVISNVDTAEPTVAPLDVTTISPEIEVPQPFDDSFMDVTQNPLEVPSEELVTETIPVLPPLGLFGGSNIDSAPQNVEEPISNEKLNADSTSQIDVEEPVSNEKLSADSTSQDIEEPMSNEKLEEIISTENTDEVHKLEETSAEQDSITEEVPLEDSTESVDSSASENHEQSSEDHDNNNIVDEATGGGFFEGVLSLLGFGSEEKEEQIEKEVTSSYGESDVPHVDLNVFERLQESTCDASGCPESETSNFVENSGMDLFSFNSDIFLYLVTTAISVIVFLFGYLALDKSKREGPLIAKINKLEKDLLVLVKENQILQEKLSTDSGYETNDRVSSEVVENLKQDLVEMTNIKNALEEQVQSLEKELENSTEVGMELNRMLSEILSSESGSDVLKANVEHLQRQLVEQQSTINSVNETLAITNTENHELRLEVELSNKKVLDLQAELDKLLLNILKIEEEKETQQSTLENEIANLRQKYEEINNKLRLKEDEYSMEIRQMKDRVEQAERKSELKSKEHEVLSDKFKQLKACKNDDSTLKSLLEVGGIQAELQLLKSENQQFREKLQQEQEMKISFEKKAQTSVEELRSLKEKYDEADKLRMETQTKLEVLSNYFKDREAQWQKEISKHEALWAEKEGEATSTTERIKFMQEQLQNYKAQTESLKQEIMSQEIELKSQISVLEKKAHENWVSARQAERKLEESKQEAAQLRHRLTLRERAIQDDKSNRLQSPIEQNGDMPVSPLESPASPPLLYGTRDHITKSPPLPGLPPFLPPPHGVPFMPPPLHGVPPFIPPPPPNMFPGDHRPPPLGRMSSPPLNSRYSPSSRGYSPYDRNSSSPSDSEYGTSPPHRRAYSPFNSRTDDRRDFKRPPAGRSNGRNLMKGGGSSGSGHSNESLEKINRQQSKV